MRSISVKCIIVYYQVFIIEYIQPQWEMFYIYIYQSSNGSELPVANMMSFCCREKDMDHAIRIPEMGVSKVNHLLLYFSDHV